VGAEAATPLVVQGGLLGRSRQIIEEQIRRQIGNAVELVGAAVKRVRATLGDHVYAAAPVCPLAASTGSDSTLTSATASSGGL